MIQVRGVYGYSCTAEKENNRTYRPGRQQDERGLESEGEEQESNSELDLCLNRNVRGPVKTDSTHYWVGQVWSRT